MPKAFLIFIVLLVVVGGAASAWFLLKTDQTVTPPAITSSAATPSSSSFTTAAGVAKTTSAAASTGSAIRVTSAPDHGGRYVGIVDVDTKQWYPMGLYSNEVGEQVARRTNMKTATESSLLTNLHLLTKGDGTIDETGKIFSFSKKYYETLKTTGLEFADAKVKLSDDLTKNMREVILGVYIAGVAVVARSKIAFYESGETFEALSKLTTVPYTKGEDLYGVARKNKTGKAFGFVSISLFKEAIKNDQLEEVPISDSNIQAAVRSLTTSGTQAPGSGYYKFRKEIGRSNLPHFAEMNGNVEQCSYFCDKNDLCTGFSRDETIDGKSAVCKFHFSTDVHNKDYNTKEGKRFSTQMTSLGNTSFESASVSQKNPRACARDCLTDPKCKAVSTKDGSCTVYTGELQKLVTKSDIGSTVYSKAPLAHCNRKTLEMAQNWINPEFMKKPSMPAVINDATAFSDGDEIALFSLSAKCFVSAYGYSYEQWCPSEYLCTDNLPAECKFTVKIVGQDKIALQNRKTEHWLKIFDKGFDDQEETYLSWTSDESPVTASEEYSENDCSIKFTSKVVEHFGSMINSVQFRKPHPEAPERLLYADFSVVHASHPRSELAPLKYFNPKVGRDVEDFYMDCTQADIPGGNGKPFEFVPCCLKDGDEKACYVKSGTTWNTIGCVQKPTWERKQEGMASLDLYAYANGNEDNEKRGHSDMCTIPDTLQSSLCKDGKKFNQGMVWKNKSSEDSYKRLLFRGPENDNTCLITEGKEAENSHCYYNPKKLDTYVVDQKHCRNFLNLAGEQDSIKQRINSHFLVLKLPKSS